MSKKKTRICPHCKKEVDAMATRCPYCTSKITPPIVKKYTILFIIFIVAVSLIFNFFSNIFSSKKENKTITDIYDKDYGKITGGNRDSSTGLISIKDIDTIMSNNTTYLTTKIHYNIDLPVIDMVVGFDIYDFDGNKVAYCKATNSLKDYEVWDYYGKIYPYEGITSFSIDRVELNEVVYKEIIGELGKIIKGGNIYSEPNNLIGISYIDTTKENNETYLRTTVSYNLSYPVTDLVVEFNIYDTENNKVGYCIATNSLKNYEEWKYKAKIYFYEWNPDNFIIDRAELLEPRYKEIIEK